MGEVALMRYDVLIVLNNASFVSQHYSFVQEYIHQLEEAKKYDHRLVGTKQELFFCHPLRYTMAYHS